MSRTTRKPAKAKKTGVPGKKADGVNSTKLIGTAKSEKGFQLGIERMQLALKKGTFALSKIIERGKNELDTIKKRDLELKALKVERESDWSFLAKFYNDELTALTENHFTETAAIDASRFIAKSRSEKISKAQETIVIAYYYAKAKASHKVVSQIYDLLVQKGAITPAKVVAEVVNVPEAATV